MEEINYSEFLVSIENQYAHCISVYKSAGIIIHLQKSNCFGVIGIDGKEYPIPTFENVKELFIQNKDLICKKIPQGFSHLELTPLANPINVLIDLMKKSILKHAEKGLIYQTRKSASDPLIPIKVNKEKQVWIWDTLMQVIDSDELIYFPQEYSNNCSGYTKSEVINNGRFCAIPGWSVGIVESLSIMNQKGQGKTLGYRKQLEIGFSPREYLKILQNKRYEGETGKTLEDFITRFIYHLETTNEISNDRYDNNAFWCLGQYVRIKYAELVPTGWWHRIYGRVRLDMHRTGNKQCTNSWGSLSTVRLIKPFS